MKKIKMDLAFDDATGLLKTLMNLTNKGVNYKVICAEGPGANWPEFEFSGEDEVLRIALKELTGDDEYYDEFVEDIN